MTLSRFFFVFDFLKLKHDMPRYSLLSIYPAWYSVSFLDIFWSLTLGTCQSLLLQIFLLFPSSSFSWYSHYHVHYTFCSCPIILEYSVLFFSLCLLSFTTLKFTWSYPLKCRDSFLAMSSMVTILSMALFWYSFWFQAFPFILF